jgi:hypothetical protein
MTVPSRMPTHELDECVCGHTAGEHSARPPHACDVGVRNPEEYGECKGGALREVLKQARQMVEAFKPDLYERLMELFEAALSGAAKTEAKG